MHFFDPITDFIFIEDEPEAADVIFIPGGPCGEIALHAAELYHQGYAPLLIPSGKHSILDPVYRGAQSPEKYRGREFPTEADFFSAILIENGVPAENILPERQATFTYENAIYTRKLTDTLGLTVRTAILSCQAYHARRALLYYQALFPDTKILVSPTVTQEIRKEDWFLKPESIDAVLKEMEHCGSQFHEIIKKYPDYAIPVH